jgi:UPF0716 protein FxsA
MSLVKWVFIGLLVFPAAEIVAFMMAAALIGWLRATALFIATSIVGVMLLRRSGRGDLNRFRAAFARDGIRAVHLESPGVATILGGILLVLPGFITDIVGLALFVPALRRWGSARLASAVRNRRHNSREDHVIDLEPDEWRQITDQTRRRRGKSDGGSKDPEDTSKGGPDDAPKAASRSRAKKGARRESKGGRKNDGGHHA